MERLDMIYKIVKHNYQERSKNLGTMRKHRYLTAFGVATQVTCFYYLFSKSKKIN